MSIIYEHFTKRKQKIEKNDVIQYIISKLFLEKPPESLTTMRPHIMLLTCAICSLTYLVYARSTLRGQNPIYTSIFIRSDIELKNNFFINF